MTRAEFERLLEEFEDAAVTRAFAPGVERYRNRERTARAAVLAAFDEAMREPTHD